MSNQELVDKLMEAIKQLAYETDMTRIAFLQGRVQIGLEIIEERGAKWTY
jgi:hypothetical protein